MLPCAAYNENLHKIHILHHRIHKFVITPHSDLSLIVYAAIHCIMTTNINLSVISSTQAVQEVGL